MDQLKTLIYSNGKSEIAVNQIPEFGEERQPAI